MNSISIIVGEGRIYLAFYFWLAGAMLVELFYEDRAVSRLLARFGMLSVILLVALRWNTGTDWGPYFKIFYTNDTSSDYDSVVFGIDQGYILLNRLMYMISRDYTVFLLVDAILAFGAMYIFIERSTRFPNMAVYLLYTSYVITHFMGSNRRMLALGFVCVGFLRLASGEPLGRRWPRWLLPFGAAMTFHRTSIAALPGLIISRKAWPTAAVIGGLLVCFVLGVTGLPFSGLEALGKVLTNYTGISAIDKLVFYTSGENQLDADFNVMHQALLGVAKRSSTLAVFILYMRYGNPTEYAQRLFNIYIVGCALYFAMIGAPIFQIISTYYSIVEVALIPIIYSGLRSLRVPYTIYLLIVPLFLLVSSLTPYIELYVPYQSVFDF